MEVLFKGPLNGATPAVKCNYIIYWSGHEGMELVYKWEAQGKLAAGNRDTVAWYFEIFEEYFAPKLIALIAVVELKRLFQGSMTLEDFHTKAVHLVKEAEYPEGDTWNRILKDTMISGIVSDKIWAKVIKEGKDVILARVMEIARLEVSTQRHIERMQKTAKVNYVPYGKSSKKKSKPRKFQQQHAASGSSSGSSGNAGNPSKHSGKGKKVPFPTDICWRCGKGRHQKSQECKALEAVCRNCSIKGHFEKVCMKGKCSTHSVGVPETSNNSTGEPSFYNEHGDPV